MFRFAFAFVSLVALAGCASTRPEHASTSEEMSCCHPANPNAPTAAMPAASTALMSDDAAPSSPIEPMKHDHADHMQHMTAPATSEPSDEKAVYTCPMHPEVTSDKPGDCPKCGMKLVKKKS